MNPQAKSHPWFGRKRTLIGAGLLLVVLTAAGGATVATVWSSAMEHLGCRNFAADWVPITPRPGESVSFLAIGDTGTDNGNLERVARGIARTCDRGGCEFVLLLGDVFYPKGVRSADDPLFKKLVEEPLDPLNLPLYPVLGNHDTANGGAIYQVGYSQKNPLWRMANFSYRFRQGPASFFALNSGCGLLTLLRLKDWLTSAPEGWNIVFAHHPIYTSGPPRGADLLYRWFWNYKFDGRVDFYLSGHSHWLEHLGEGAGGTDYIVSGAGSDPKAVKGPLYGEGSAVKSIFQHTGLGFVWMSLSAHEAKVEFLNAQGQVLHGFTRTR